MTRIQFVWLIKEIYGKKLPDLDKIQGMGLLAVKIAQHFALRIDFLDEKVCTHLAKLYQNTVEIDEKRVDYLLKQGEDKEFMEKFSYFEKKPLASASIGQVHRATLHDGSKVVIKIVKENYRDDFLKDLENLKKFLKGVLFFYPKLKRVFNPLEILDYIEEYTLEELNLLNEIKGQEMLHNISTKNKDIYDLSDLSFHKIYKEISSENILVSEEIQGETFKSLMDRGVLTYESLLKLFHIHGFYIFKIGIFHGDIHPGNIFYRNDGKIDFVDTGAISSVKDNLRDGLYNFFKALAYYDFKNCAFYLNEMSEVKLQGEKYNVFLKNMLNLYSDFEDATVSQVSLTKRMMETIKMGVLHGMHFEEGMFGIIKSLMYLDGMVLKVNPNAILVKDMRAFIKEFDILRESEN